MIDRSQWATTTVSYFFSVLPWQGRQTTAPLPEQPQPLDFRLLSVWDFFASITWSGQPQLAVMPEQGRGLSNQMSVRQFFSHFAWQGVPSIGVVPQIHLRPAQSPDLDISDLSDLF